MTAHGESLISCAGSSLLVDTSRLAGLDTALSRALAPWRRSGSIHDPGKIVLDLAMALALGGDCLADVAVVRAQPHLLGPTASDPTVSRLVVKLATDAPAAFAALRQPRAAARERLWQISSPAPAKGHIVIDLDATIVLAHSEEEDATATRGHLPRAGEKRTFGFHPLLAFADHGPGGTGEHVGGRLRTGRATANDAAAHIEVLADALAQLPEHERSRVPARGDAGAGVQAFVRHLHEAGLAYSVGLYVHHPILEAIPQIPKQAWRAAIEPEGAARDSAQVTEITRYALADDLLAWMQHLAWTGTAARTREPKRLRLQLLSVAGRIVRTTRRRLLPRDWPWTGVILAGHHRLAAFSS